MQVRNNQIQFFGNPKRASNTAQSLGQCQVVPDKFIASGSLSNVAAFIPQNPKISAHNISFAGKNPISDAKYKGLLAEGINKLLPELHCKPQDLSSIVGARELAAVLKKSKPENFSVGGSGLENVKNGVFNINLHTHTTDSDGRFTVEELLNATADYADKISKPVYIAITNHDSIQDLPKAVELVAKNKDKYKNVRVVLGVEFNAKYENTKMFKKPLQLEMLGYCVNPFDRRFKGFMRQIKTVNKNIATDIITKVNEKCGTKIKFADVKDFDSSIKNCGSPSFLKQLKKALSEKIEPTGQAQEALEAIFKERASKHGDIKLTDATPSMKQIVTIVNETSGFVGVAHPVRNSLGSKINLPTREEREAKYEEYLTRFFADFKNAGGKSLEAHYQYNHAWHLKHPFRYQKIEMVKNIQQRFGFLGASGLDCHQKSIFENE